jgi:hypothetical protein
MFVGTSLDEKQRQKVFGDDNEIKISKLVTAMKDTTHNHYITMFNEIDTNNVRLYGVPWSDLGMLSRFTAHFRSPVIATHAPIVDAATQKPITVPAIVLLRTTSKKPSASRASDFVKTYKTALDHLSKPTTVWALDKKSKYSEPAYRGYIRAAQKSAFVRPTGAPATSQTAPLLPLRQTTTKT